MMLTRRSFAHLMGIAPLNITCLAQAEALSEDFKLKQILEPIRAKYALPALAGGIVTTSGLERVAATGVRKAGGTTQATIGDLWHLGSDTKAMTASLVAMLVEDHKLGWEDNLAALFPNLSSLHSSELGKVSVTQLLHHTAGLPANLPWSTFQAKGGSLMEQRQAVLEEALRIPLITTPGTSYLYSNIGYVLAGLIIENRTGKAWEEVMKERLFIPLGMTSSGFGGIGTLGTEDQPWPHKEEGTPLPRNGPAVDNPPVMGPAGTVHATMADWAKFIADHLRGSRGQKALLEPASYDRLHQPSLNDYGMGWIVVNRSWAGGLALTHAGTNTMNYCVTWLAPKKNFAVLVCTNRGGQSKAADEAISALIQQWQS